MTWNTDPIVDFSRAQKLIIFIDAFRNKKPTCVFPVHRLTRINTYHDTNTSSLNSDKTATTTLRILNTDINHDSKVLYIPPPISPPLLDGPRGSR